MTIYTIDGRYIDFSHAGDVGVRSSLKEFENMPMDGWVRGATPAPTGCLAPTTGQTAADPDGAQVSLSVTVLH